MGNGSRDGGKKKTLKERCNWLIMLTASSFVNLKDNEDSIVIHPIKCSVIIQRVVLGILKFYLKWYDIHNDGIV